VATEDSDIIIENFIATVSLRYMWAQKMWFLASCYAIWLSKSARSNQGIANPAALTKTGDGRGGHLITAQKQVNPLAT
jgi:hypothetical protein